MSSPFTVITYCKFALFSSNYSTANEISCKSVDRIGTTDCIFEKMEIY